MSGGPYLTEDEREIIRSLFVEHGAPLRFIAHAVGRHWRTVQNITVKLGQERLDHLKRATDGMTTRSRGQR